MSEAILACTAVEKTTLQQPLQDHLNQLAAEVDGEGDVVGLGGADGEALGQTGDTGSCTRLMPRLAHKGGQAGGGSSREDSASAKSPLPTKEESAARHDSGLDAFADTRIVTRDPPIALAGTSS